LSVSNILTYLRTSSPSSATSDIPATAGLFSREIEGKEKENMALDDIPTERVIINVALVTFGIAALAIVGMLEATFIWDGTSYQISNYAVGAGFLTLAAAAVLGEDLDLEGMDTWELVGVLVAVLVLASVEFVPEVGNFITGQYAPWTQIGAVLVGYIGAWSLAFGGD
jgi:hypothetical protein